MLHTLNKALLSAVSALAHTAEASTLTLSVLAEILRGPATARYLAEHRDRLASAHFGVCALLDKHRIQYSTAEAGVFVMLQLAEFLTSDGRSDDGDLAAAEQRLWHELLENTKVGLSEFGMAASLLRID